MQGEAERAFLAFREHGRPRDLARVFDLTAQELLLVAAHLARGGTEAEELVQRTFLAALERRASFDTARPLMPWLLGILARLASEERRRWSQEQERRGGSPDELASVAAGPARQAEEAELAEALSAAIATLPEAYREVLSLRLVHGLEAVEIAHALGRPLDTVKTQLKRGKERLREALPRSLAALVALERDGLAGVKSAVLAAAQGTTAGTALVTLGVLLMSKKAVGVAVVLACAGALWWSRSTGDGDGGSGAAQASGAAPLVSTSESERKAELLPAKIAGREALATPGPAPLVPATARLTCRVTFATDGAPAEGVMIALWHTGLGRVPARPRIVSSTSGAVVFEGLPPGRAVIDADRGARAELVLRPGDNEIELGIPAGVLVAGIVLDEREQPVGGAELWISEAFSGDEGGWWAARAGVDGRFALRDVRPNGTLAARSDGNAPGEGVCINGAVGDRVEVTLHVGKPGSRLEGVVRDELGIPIAGAAIFVGYGVGPHRRPNNGGPDTMNPPPQCTSTDNQGRFELDAVPNSTPLWVAADGYATVRERVTPERAGGMVILLAPEARLQGSVRDPQGAALAGVEVSVSQVEDDGSLAARIQTPRWSWKQVLTELDGSFEIGALAAGSTELRAFLRTLGEARTTVELVAGETCIWSAVVQAAGVIEGFVVDERGEPVVGLHVSASFSAVGQETEYLPSATTALDGAFRLTGATRESYTVRVREPESDLPATLVLRDVAPNVDAFEVVFGEERRPTGRFTARILDHEGRPFVADSTSIERVEADNTRSRGGNASRCTEGRLVSGPLPPGLYRLGVRSADAGFATLGTFELSAGETRDLGEVVVPLPGRIEVEVRDEAGQRPREGALTALSESSGMGVGITLRDGRGKAERLQPGTYVVMSDGYTFPLVQQRVEVRSSETSHVVIELPTALTRWIAYPTMEGDGYVEFEVAWTCDGRELCRKLGSGLVQGVVQRPLAMRVPPGRHVVTLTLPDGRSATTTFDVNENTTTPELAVWLRSPIGP